MNVYILGTQDRDDYDDMAGVYSSREKAIESFPFHEQKYDESDIREWEIDPANGERYIDGFYAGIEQRTGRKFNGPQRFKESENGKLTLGSSDGIYTYAIAPTLAEAERIAEAGLSQIDPVWMAVGFRGQTGSGEWYLPNAQTIPEFNPAGNQYCYAIHKDKAEAKRIVEAYIATGETNPALTVL